MKRTILPAPGRAVRARNLAAADQALAFLRDQDGFPYSTGELAERFFNFRVGWRQRHACQGCDHRCEHWHDAGRSFPDAPTCRTHMLRLARIGLVERIPVEADYRLFWRATRVPE